MRPGSFRSATSSVFLCRQAPHDLDLLGHPTVGLVEPRIDLLEPRINLVESRVHFHTE